MSLVIDAVEQEKVATATKAALDDIYEFVSTAPFQALLEEMWALPLADRPSFVSSVVLSEEQRQLRGVHVPDRLIVQRSAFSDGRPTLFCVTKALPPDLHWKKVTITYDNPLEDEPG
jgi:hypothetical protein